MEKQRQGHTEGPWTAYPQMKGGKEYGQFGDNHNIFGPDGVAIPVNKANAALIAASPELLEACKAMIEAINLNVDNSYLADETEAMSKAIAQAEGRV